MNGWHRTAEGSAGRRWVSAWYYRGDETGGSVITLWNFSFNLKVQSAGQHGIWALDLAQVRQVAIGGLERGFFF